MSSEVFLPLFHHTFQYFCLYWKSKLAAISGFPPVASNSLKASSLLTPNPTILFIADSGCVLVGVGATGGAGGAGDDKVLPEPGKGVEAAGAEAEEEEAVGAEGGGIGFPCLIKDKRDKSATCNEFEQ